MTAACRKHAGSDGAKKLLALPFAFLLLPYHGSDRPLTQAVLTVALLRAAFRNSATPATLQLCNSATL